MSYELTKKALENLSTTVPIDEATVPSPTVRVEILPETELTTLLLDTLRTTAKTTQLMQADGQTKEIVYIDPPKVNEKRTIDVKFEPTTGTLTFVKADGSVLEVVGLPTITSLGRGPQGPKGKRGKRGKDGRDGKDGPRGYEGIRGPKGPVGNIGISGAPGKPGGSGRQGPQGPRGAIGPEGPLGPQGRQGYTGARGLNGCPGPTGPTGPTGPAGSGAVFISSDAPGDSVYLWGYPI